MTVHPLSFGDRKSNRTNSTGIPSTFQASNSQRQNRHVVCPRYDILLPNLSSPRLLFQLRSSSSPCYLPQIHILLGCWDFTSSLVVSTTGGKTKMVPSFRDPSWPYEFAGDEVLIDLFHFSRATRLVGRLVHQPQFQQPLPKSCRLSHVSIDYISRAPS